MPPGPTSLGLRLIPPLEGGLYGIYTTTTGSYTPNEKNGYVLPPVAIFGYPYNKVQRPQHSWVDYGGGGIWATFPVLFPTATVGFYVHSAITAILSFNTLFNFCMAAFTLAGPSPTTEYGKYDLVGRKSLEGYKFCVYCKRPKPPNAHHCRSCESCVVEMDHHCPFIGNCVGSNNLHYFLLFLVFAMVSGFYLFGMTLFVGSKVWPNLMKFRRAHLPRLYKAISFDIIAVLLASMIVNVERVASIRAFVFFYLFISSMGLAMGIGLLLYHQVQLVYTGQTYIGSLSSGGGEREQDKSWTNFKKVFGKRHPCLWLLPRINSKRFAPSQKVH